MPYGLVQVFQAAVDTMAAGFVKVLLSVAAGDVFFLSLPDYGLAPTDDIGRHDLAAIT